MSDPVRVRTLSRGEVRTYLLAENIQAAEKFFQDIKLPPRIAGLPYFRGTILAVQFLK